MTSRLDYHGAVADAVEEEAERGSEDADQDAGNRRTDDPGAVEDRGVERNGVGDVLAADHLDDERLAGGHVDRVDEAEQECQHEYMPDLDDLEGDQCGENQGQQPGRGLGPDDRLPLGPYVGDDPAEEAQDQDGHELNGSEEADVYDRLL